MSNRKLENETARLSLKGGFTKLRGSVLAILFLSTVMISWTFIAATSEELVLNEQQKKQVEEIIAEQLKKQQIDMGAFIRSYLLENPEVLQEAFTALEEKQAEQRRVAQTEALKNYQDQIFNPDTDFIMGNPDGDVTMVEFFDYNCGFCRRALSDLNALLQNDPNLKVVLKEMPVLSEGSVAAARLSMASRNQDKYTEYHNALFATDGGIDAQSALRVAEEIGLDVDQLTQDAENPAFTDGLTQTLQMANELGINGTPSYIVGDRLVIGAVGYDELKRNIDEIRAENKAKAAE